MFFPRANFHFPKCLQLCLFKTLMYLTITVLWRKQSKLDKLGLKTSQTEVVVKHRKLERCTGASSEHFWNHGRVVCLTINVALPLYSKRFWIFINTPLKAVKMESFCGLLFFFLSLSTCVDITWQQLQFLAYSGKIEIILHCGLWQVEPPILTGRSYTSLHLACTLSFSAAAWLGSSHKY